MVTKRLVPCVDVRAGRVVKSVKFQGLKDMGDPAELALAYQQQGADEIMLLDVGTTDEDRASSAATVQAVREVLGIPLTVGGWVGSVEDVEATLAAGADRVSVNSAEVADPTVVSRLADRFGRQCVVVAIDAREVKPTGDTRQYEAPVGAGTEPSGRDAAECAAEFESMGAGEILLTSWDRDGTGLGYDLGLLRSVCGSVRLPVIASGGADSPEHMVEAFEAGADAVLAASIFHDQVVTVEDIKRRLQTLGVDVRL